MTTSRLISSPTSRKKIAISRSLIQSSRGLSRRKLPSRTPNGTSQQRVVETRERRVRRQHRKPARDHEQHARRGFELQELADGRKRRLVAEVVHCAVPEGRELTSLASRAPHTTRRSWPRLPACSARASSATVLPVVITSSTITIRRPRTGPCPAVKAPCRLACRSAGARPTCGRVSLRRTASLGATGSASAPAAKRAISADWLKPRSA